MTDIGAARCSCRVVYRHRSLRPTLMLPLPPIICRARSMERSEAAMPSNKRELPRAGLFRRVRTLPISSLWQFIGNAISARPISSSWRHATIHRADDETVKENIDEKAESKVSLLTLRTSFTRRAFPHRLRLPVVTIVC